MHLKSLEISGFKSFGKKCTLEFQTPITAVVGPNGSGKSNLSEAFRFVLGEQSFKSMRGKRGEDLLWNGSTAVPRANRASVKLTLDNTKRLLNLDFDEVVLEREVHRDGVNEYRINGSAARLKDIVELLAGANIGSSGHHIISQGEADRILSATPKERRAMIEDALGLRVYQYKKQESIKKLEKTEENKAQVEALRKENTPHLKFLERQMQKIERARELRTDVVRAYRQYLKREELYLKYENERLKADREAPERELRNVQDQLTDARKALTEAEGSDRTSAELLSLEKELNEVRGTLNEQSRSLGRLEGQIAYEERRVEEEKRRLEKEEAAPVPFDQVRAVAQKIESKHIEAQPSDSLDHVKGLLYDAHIIASELVEQYRTHQATPELDENALATWRHEREELEAQRVTFSEREQELQKKVQAIKEGVEKEKDASRELERAMFTLMNQESEVRARLRELTVRQQEVTRAEENFRQELAEAGALIGRDVSGYADEPLVGAGGTPMTLEEMGEEERTAQENRRRELEKMKIRLEELGGAGADEITKEYAEVKERDSFLEREINDLAESTVKLKDLIKELEQELDQKFKEGIDRIGAQFNEFFMLMFGGGRAELKVLEAKKSNRVLQALGFGKDDEAEEEGENAEEEEGEGSAQELGIDIGVSLPNKRVKGLMMLSGGERALTSIALIFAMSQISAPPFIILDETDAALDEANSRRYGDMIETLAKHSQLILITHNRETMSRAGVLYGVTMGGDGVSKLLSVRLEEAVAVAK